MKKKDVLITGAAGLIGSFLAELLVRRGFRVTIIDDFSKGRIEHLSAIKSEIEIRRGNLESKEFTNHAFDGEWHHVYHLASRAYGIAYSRNHHLDVISHNEEVTNNVLSALRRIETKGVTIISSSCVHKDGGPETTPELPLFEEEPETANWGYGWAKRFLEQKFIIYEKITGVPVTILRPFNIYGERYSWQGEYSQAIPMLIKKIMDRENPIVIWGSGNQRRNYMHAQDCARLIHAVSEKKFSGQAVNIGSEKTISISDLVVLVKTMTGIKSDVVFDTTKPEGRFVKSANSSKLRQIIGTERIHEIGLEEGLCRMLEWYKQTFTDQV